MRSISVNSNTNFQNIYQNLQDKADQAEERALSGEPALTKFCHGFDSWLVVVQLRVQEQQKRLLGFDPLLSVTLCFPHGH